MAYPESELVDVPEGFDTAAAWEAWDAVDRFWRAIATDDDEETARLTLLAEPSPVTGLSARVRKLLGVDISRAETIGVSSSLRITNDGTWVFFCTSTGVIRDRPVIYEQAQWRPGFMLIAARGPNGWAVGGFATPEQLEGSIVFPLPPHEG
jgi:hypothetical protein